MAYSYVREENKPNSTVLGTWKKCAYEKGIELKAVQDVLVVELRDALSAYIRNEDTEDKHNSRRKELRH